jgi:predicted phosphodiesterase
MGVRRFAVLSDIHGNRWALEAVFADLERRGIREAVNLGDSLYGPLDPAGTARMLLERPMPAVRGNEDRILCEPPPDYAHPATLEHARRALTAKHLEWLDSLPAIATAFGDFFLCHGTPSHDETYMLRRVTAEGVTEREAKDLETDWPDSTCTVLLCGHDHTPGGVSLPGGRVILNPGSVGLPAYTDDKPRPHAVANGTPHARYCVVVLEETGWQAEWITLSYDWDAAAEAAARGGRPDWAKWLKTGRT